MKPKFILTVAILALSAGPALAQRDGARAPSFPRLNVFAAQIYALEPGIDAVLLLTDEQKTKIIEAHKATLEAPELQETIKKLRDRGAAEGDRKAASEQYEKAQAEMKKRVGEILTTDQQLTIKKVEDSLKSAFDSALSKDQKEALEKTKRNVGRR